MSKIVTPSGDLNFTRLAELLEDEAGLERGTGAKVLRAVLTIIARHVAAGFRVRLTNFGSFLPLTRRVGTGGLPHRRAEGIRMPSETRVARFRPSGLFAQAVRNGEPVFTLQKRAKGSVSSH